MTCSIFHDVTRIILCQPGEIVAAFYFSKRVYFLVFLAATGLLLLPSLACSNPTTGRAVALGEPVTMAIGQKVSFAREPLSIAFVEVVSDSRCPSGATCVWQGEASCRLSITFRDSSNSLIVTQPGLTETPATTDFDQYQIQYRLRPYPALDKQIKPGDYRLELTVRRKA